MTDASARSRLVALAYLTLLVALVATSAPRLVGDARDYVLMATDFASGRFPRPHSTDHFWLYPALASPGVWAADATGTNPLYAFAVVNVALLGASAWIVSRRLPWSIVVLLFAGPILWWTDKPHTEPFTFALMAAACTFLATAPWWSMAALSVASTQNPPFALLAGIVALGTWWNDPAVLGDRRFRRGVMGALAVAALHPLYYWLRLGSLTALDRAATPHIPGLNEYLAPLVDPNIGLLPAFPGLVVAGCLAVAAWVWQRRALSRLDAIVVAAALVLLASVSQAGNVNHGGTPGLSRYALWLIPLAIPLLEACAPIAAARRGLGIVAVASAALCVWVYHPSRPDGSTTPTRLAMWLWTTHPAIDNPLPEVFIERLSGREDMWLPQSTPGCEKILLTGRGPSIGVWPVWCALGSPVPDACRAPNAMCYANRDADGYAFAPYASGRTLTSKVRRDLVWSPLAEATMRQLLRALGAGPLRPTTIGGADALVRAAHGVGVVFLLQSNRDALVYLGPLRDGGSLTLASPEPLDIRRIDPERGIPGDAVRWLPSSPVVLAASERPQAIYIARTPASSQ